MKTFILSPRKDFLLFFFPSLFTCVCLFLASYWEAPEKGFLLAILLFILIYVLDIGHTYTTAVRLLPFSKHAKYFSLAGLIFVINLLLLFTRPSLLFQIYVYATFFHHVRQYWGLTAWYQKLYGRSDRRNFIFSQILPVFPFLSYHFDIRTKTPEYFQKGVEFFHYPSESLYAFNLIFFIVFLVCYFSYEWTSYRKHSFEVFRVLSITIPTLTHIFSFMIFNFSELALLPLLVGHSITYYLILSYSMNVNFAQKSKIPWVGILLFVAVLMGTFHFSLDSLAASNSLHPESFAFKFLIAFLALPALWHYVVDSFVWKTSNKEAKRMYKDSLG